MGKVGRPKKTNVGVLSPHTQIKGMVNIEGKETLKKIIDNIQTQSPKKVKVQIRIDRTTGREFQIKLFPALINEYLYDENLRMECLDLISRRGFIVKFKDSAINLTLSREKNEMMQIEANKVKVPRSELYRQLIYMYQSGEVKFNLPKWEHLLKFTNL